MCYSRKHHSNHIINYIPLSHISYHSNALYIIYIYIQNYYHLVIEHRREIHHKHGNITCKMGNISMAMLNNQRVTYHIYRLVSYHIIRIISYVIHISINICTTDSPNTTGWQCPHLQHALTVWPDLGGTITGPLQVENP